MTDKERADAAEAALRCIADRINRRQVECSDSYVLGQVKEIVRTWNPLRPSRPGKQRHQQRKNVTMDTPWGPALTVDQLAEGITLVSTISHGGIHLSAERVAEMPPDQRVADGWYEEDCEMAFVLHHFMATGVLDYSSDYQKKAADFVASLSDYWKRYPGGFRP